MAANNTCSFIGNVTATPEIRNAGEDNKVASFSIAVSRRTKSDHPESDFFNCEAWNGLAGVIENYVNKGSKIAVRCRAKQDKFEDKDGNKRTAIRFVVEDLQLLDKKGTTTTDDDDDLPM